MPKKKAGKKKTEKSKKGKATKPSDASSGANFPNESIRADKTDRAQEPDITREDLAPENDLAREDELQQDDDGSGAAENTIHAKSAKAAKVLKISKDPSLDPVHVVEAALFSAGHPLKATEIADLTDLDKDTVKSCVKKLRADYEHHHSAIEVAPIGGKFVMQIRGNYLEQAARVSPLEIPRGILKTAALIAYYQPIRQSRLQLMVGSKVYAHVKELDKYNLIRTKRVGQTLELSTSRAFIEYFGIDARKREDVKKWLAGKVGIKFNPRKARVDEPKSSGEGDESDGTAVLEPAQEAGTPDAEGTVTGSGGEDGENDVAKKTDDSQKETKSQ